MYYELSNVKLKSAGYFFPLSALSMMILGFVLATSHSNFLNDYNYYANSYSPSIEKYHRPNYPKAGKEISNSLFVLSSPLSEFNPLTIIQKFSARAANDIPPSLKLSFVPDTTVPDTTKKKQDSLGTKIIDTLVTGDSVEKKDSDSPRPEMTGKIADTTKKVIPPAIDSLTFSVFDSLMTIDSLRLIDSNATKGAKPLFLADSTARINNFKYKPPDKLYTSIIQTPNYGLFGPKKSVITYETKIDSATNMVIVSEKVDGKLIKVPVWLTMEDYINICREYFTRKNFVDLAHRYELKLKQEKIEIGSLLSTITNIDIPIPENPLMSIFGDRSRINLRISGSVNIRGAFRSSTTDGMTSSQLGNTRNEPDFKQTVSIQVDGTVGDKLNIGANWDTQRMFEYENSLKIGYKGYEDEIIQSIEAGNVGMSTTSALVGSSQALFGIKANLQIGPLKLTTVASQKKSEKKEMSISGGTQKQQFSIRPEQYSTSHYWIDSSYRQLYTEYYGNSPSNISKPDMRIMDDIEVWVTRMSSIPDPEEREIVADIELAPLETQPGKKYDNAKYKDSTTVQGRLEIGRFIKLKNDQFILQGSGYPGIITIRTSIDQSKQAIAVAYKTADGKTYGNFANTLDTSQKVMLKLVKPANLNPEFKKAWAQQVKSIYFIGGGGINKETLQNVKMMYTVPGGTDADNLEGVSLLTMFGLDYKDESGAPNPDGKFDFEEGRTINASRGEIIFPYPEPFNQAFGKYTKELNGKDTTYRFPDIYTSTTTIAQQNTSKNRFLLKGEYTGTSSSTYRLGMSVVPGSVKVFYNGNELSAGSDYIIDEIGGQIILKKEEAMVPGANVQVKYEENDLISFSSKTLLGASGEMDLGKTTKLGFAWMNLIQQSLSDKVRLGEEPINNSIFGASISSSFDLPFITKALNYLPFYSSSDPSSISLHAEGAYILPDPNTRKSVIDIDNGESVAYVDDFEGSRQYIPLGLGYAVWHYPSAPVELSSGPISDKAATDIKARSYWFNIMPSDVQVKEIWPQKLVATQDNYAQYLTYVYTPKTRAQYNYNSSFSASAGNWGGIMRSLGSNAQKLLDNNYNYIEIWMKVESPSGASLANAKMNIDLGLISEKVIVDPRVHTNNGIHTEDGCLPTNTTMNGILEEGEDLGIDAIDDNAEKAMFPELASESDPSGDNFGAVDASNPRDPNSYTNINGVEGNRQNSDVGGLFPDMEDLNHNGVLDQTNSYYEYEISLDPDIAKQKMQIVGGGNEGWYQFRIPLDQYKKTVGTPNLNTVESIRVWVSGASDRIVLKIAQFDIVGNQWIEVKNKNAIAKDTTLKVAVVSIEENPKDYGSPRANLRARDRTRPNEEIYGNEQSLMLEVKGIPDGGYREAVKYFTGRPLDVFNYKTMRMFVWGENTFKYIDTSNYDAEFIFKFGVDTANYYAYTMPIRPCSRPDPKDLEGWAMEWNKNEITIDFNKLTSAKANQKIDTTTKLKDSVGIPVEGKPGAYYVVKGNPTLTNITYLSVGVKNTRQKYPKQEIYGQVWIDELRLCSANNDPGAAYRIDGSIKLANLASVSFNYGRTDPNFHSIDTRFGNRNDDRSWSVSGNFALHNLLPREMSGTNLSVSYSRSEVLNDPKYLPGTDVIVAEAAATKSLTDAAEGERIKSSAQTLTVSETFAIPSVVIKVPIRKWYIEETINKLNFSFNYNSTKTRDPNTEWRKTWGWNFSTAYNIGLTNLGTFSPFTGLFSGVFLLDQYKDLKISFLPDVGLGLNASRSRIEEKQRAEKNDRNPIRSFGASRNMNMKFRFSEGGLLNLSADYAVSVTSSYTHLETIVLDTNARDALGRSRLDSLQQRSNKDIFSDIFTKSSLINFGTDNGYSQTISLITKPSLPTLLSLNEYVDVGGDYKVDYKWAYNPGASNNLGISAGFVATLSSSMTFKLKALGDKIFGAPAPDDASSRKAPLDHPTDTVKSGGGIKLNFKDILRALIKYPLFDYEQISVAFSQNNNAQNGGLRGNTGWSNFWGLPFVQGSNSDFGPSRAYQLGLISDPTGKLVNFGARSRFPFFGFDYVPGPRVEVPVGTSVALTDNFTQTNNLSLATNRNLYEGVSVNLNWKVGWTYNRNTSFNVDDKGNVIQEGPRKTTYAITSNLDRSFITLPNLFFSKLLGAGGIEKVSELYGSSIADITDEDPNAATKRSEKLAAAFEQGFEFLPLLTKIFGAIAPRANWSIRWSGLEKIPFLSKFANSISLTHAYTSGQTKRFKTESNTGSTVVDGQRISYNFSPLLGVDFSFKEILGGNFSANFRYSTGQSYDLSAGASNIIEQSNKDISGTASFSKQGFEIPLFGLYLRNDIDFSITFGISSTGRKQYSIQGDAIASDGVSDDNSSRTSIEPRFTYRLSSKVTGSAYYKFSKTSSARILGNTSNEVGLDVTISIN